MTKRRYFKTVSSVTKSDESTGWGKSKSMVTIDGFELLGHYSRKELQEQFGITDATIFTGIFQPKGHSSIWLFVTEEKTSDRTDYYDSFDGQILNFEGQRSGRTDNKIIDHISERNDLLVFFRKKKDQYSNYAFAFLGRFQYVTHEGEKPKRFVLQSLDLAEGDDGGYSPADQLSSPPENLSEGRSRTRVQTYYERNPRLRAEALRLHGTKCFACGFEFSRVYGPHGEGFIEIHHLKPISSYTGDTNVSPEKDLVPLCSNCHRMVHRKEKMLTLNELRGMIDTSEYARLQRSDPISKSD